MVQLHLCLALITLACDTLHPLPAYPAPPHPSAHRPPELSLSPLPRGLSAPCYFSATMWTRAEAGVTYRHRLMGHPGRRGAVSSTFLWIWQ